MRSVLSLATFAIGNVLRNVRDEGKASFRHCCVFAEPGASPVMRSALRVCPEGEPKLFHFQER
jgi:hypothetical protein